MEEFVARTRQLGSPFVSPGDRSAADAWLRSFRETQDAWTVCLALIGQGNVGLAVQLQAAQTLVWKCRNQVNELGPHWRALVESLLAVLEAQHGPPSVACCLALAALSLRVLEWEDPCSQVVRRLPRDLALQFVTVLPQEGQDAVKAAGIDGLSFQFQERLRLMCGPILTWLQDVMMVGRNGTPEPDPKMWGAVLTAFGAWVSWGCFAVVDRQQAAFFTRLAFNALIAEGDNQGQMNNQLLAASVLEDVLEKAGPEQRDVILEGALQVAVLAAEQTGQVPISNFYASFCADPAFRGDILSNGPKGALLRKGLLDLLSLTRVSGIELKSSMACGLILGLEAPVESIFERWQGDSEAEGALSKPEQHEFLTSALRVLMRVLAPQPAALDPIQRQALPNDDDDFDGCGIPEDVREQAKITVALAIECLKLNEFVELLVEVVQATSMTGHHLEVLAMLETCLFMLPLDESGRGSSLTSSGDPSPPLWLTGVCSLLSAVPSDQPPTILHLSFLRAVESLASPILSLLSHCSPPAAVELEQRIVAVAVGTFYSLQINVATNSNAFEGRMITAAARALRALSNVRDLHLSPGSLAEALEVGLNKLFEYSLSLEAAGALVEGLICLLDRLDRQSLAATLQNDRQREGLLPTAQRVAACCAAQPGDISLAGIKRVNAMLQALEFHGASVDHPRSSPETSIVVALMDNAVGSFLEAWQVTGPQALELLRTEWFAEACMALQHCCDLCPARVLPFLPSLTHWATLCLAKEQSTPAANVLCSLIPLAASMPERGRTLVESELGRLSALWSAAASTATVGLDPDMLLALMRVLRAALKALRPVPGGGLLEATVRIGACQSTSRSSDVAIAALSLLCTTLVPLGVENEREQAVEALRPLGPVLVTGLFGALMAPPLGGRLPMLASLASSLGLLALLCALREGRTTDAPVRQRQLLDAWSGEALLFRPSADHPHYAMRGIMACNYDDSALERLQTSWDWGPPAADALYQAARLLGSPIPEPVFATLPSEPAARRGLQRVVRLTADAMRRS